MFIAILLPVVSNKDKMLKYILTYLAYDKQHCTNVFIIRWVLHNDNSLEYYRQSLVIMIKCFNTIAYDK